MYGDIHQDDLSRLSARLPELLLSRWLGLGALLIREPWHRSERAFSHSICSPFKPPARPLEKEIKFSLMEPQSARRCHKGDFFFFSSFFFFVPCLLVPSALSHFIFRISTSPEKWITHHGKVSITFSDSKRIIGSFVCASLSELATPSTPRRYKKAGERFSSHLGSRDVGPIYLPFPLQKIKIKTKKLRKNHSAVTRACLLHEGVESSDKHLSSNV